MDLPRRSRDGHRAHPARDHGDAAVPSAAARRGPTGSDARPAVERPSHPRLRARRRRGRPGRWWGRAVGLGEVVDPKTRAEMLDEGLDVLTALLSGERVDHDGPHHQAKGVTFLPTATRPGGIPIWIGGRWPNEPPQRRAARFDGYFVFGLGGPDDVAEAQAAIDAARATAGRGRPGRARGPGARWHAGKALGRRRRELDAHPHMAEWPHAKGRACTPWRCTRRACLIPLGPESLGAIEGRYVNPIFANRHLREVANEPTSAGVTLYPDAARGRPAAMSRLVYGPFSLTRTWTSLGLSSPTPRGERRRLR